ncbi:hypothetical protein CSE16_08925 [Solibacillus sp. R5-41]|uniref:FHA domain-containing protein n=1 Tax=Solibacillus sp. R5-41 TaxID=2048654 RepID=UPI000C127012|nr:FHA domain-containing protein [Solibacillus sp. R5-41]ATP40162.1 hypothetical protein CSE16_08925 [Solibacillus sp. R5-41]
MSGTNNSIDTQIHERSRDIQIAIIIIDAIIVIIILFMIVFVLKQDTLLKIMVGSLFSIVVIVYGILKIIVKDNINGGIGPGIKKLVLLSQDGEIAREWDIQGKTSLLIGKSTTNQEVDINLSGTEYESLISNEHAVLNCVSEAWYLEDIDSVNGVGIKKADKRIKNRLRHESPYRINNGDTIYIANTRILVK